MRNFLRLLRDPDPATNPDSGGPVKVNNSLPEDTYTPPDIKMAEALPPDLRDKPFFKDKSFVEVMKEHANLQTLLGQRPAGIPKDDAPDEEWGKFLGAMKPKAADEYVLPETEFSKKTPRTPEQTKAIKEFLFNADVPKRAATKIVTLYDALLDQAGGITEAQKAEAVKTRETEFEGLLDKTYGAQKQVVIDRTKKLMTESVDPAQKESVAKVLKDISNDTLFALTAVLEGVYKKHIAEDATPVAGGHSTADVASLQAEAEKIMSSDTYKDFRRSGHDESKLKVQEIFKQIAAAKK